MTNSTTTVRSISTYAGVVGFTAKSLVTGLSFVGGLVVATANAAATTSIGGEIHKADGIKGAVSLGVDLSFRAIDNLMKDKVVEVVSAEEVDTLLEVKEEVK